MPTPEPPIEPRRRPRRLLSALPLLALVLPLLALAGCGDDEGTPVGRLTVDPARIELPHGAWRDVVVHLEMGSELEGLRGDPLLFVHLLDADGRLTRTFDRPIAGGWSRGDDVELPVRVYQSVLAPPLPPGEYTLTAGLYDTEDNRWPLEVAGEDARIGRSEYRVARVTVPAGPADLPAIGFSRTWSPTLAGTDRQVLANRWLTGDGSIRLQEIQGSGTLWLALRIPRPGDGGAQIMPRRARATAAGDADAGDEDGEAAGAGSVDEGTAAGDEAVGTATATEGTDGGGAGPSVRVTARCSGFASSVSGAGGHDVEVPVEPGEEGACEVRLEPDYRRVLDGMEEQTVMVEVIAWNGEER